MQKLSFVYYYSENRATSRIWKVLPNMVFPPIWGKTWRRSEHAHASYPGLSFRPPGFNPFMGREERRVQGLDYDATRAATRRARVPYGHSWFSFVFILLKFFHTIHQKLHLILEPLLNYQEKGCFDQKPGLITNIT